VVEIHKEATDVWVYQYKIHNCGIKVTEHDVTDGFYIPDQKRVSAP